MCYMENRARELIQKVVEGKNPVDLLGISSIREGSHVDLNKFVQSLGVDFSKLPVGDKGEKIKSIDIDPKGFGLMGIIYKKITLQVIGGRSSKDPDTTGAIYLDYKWDYLSGSNGYSISMFTRDGGRTWQSRDL